MHTLLQTPRCFLHIFSTCRRFGVVFTFLFLLTVPVAAFSPFYSGICTDINMNSYDSIALGAGIESLYSLTPCWKTGVSIRTSSEFDRFTSLEALLEFNYVFETKFFDKSLSLSAGADIGFEQIWFDSTSKKVISTGIELRSFISPKSWNVTLSPYAKCGYPYLWAVGVSCGVLF